MKLESSFSIILSRTDALGDTVLTIPMAGVLKKYFPKCKVYYLGRAYVKPVVELSKHIDGFIEYDYLISLTESEQIHFLKSFKADVFVHVFPRKELAVLARKAGIRERVGTTNRLFHWFNCNRLVPFSRKRSDKHESQLNMQLLRFLSIPVDIPLDEIHCFYGVETALLHDSVNDNNKQKVVIIHPGSNGSGREWTIDNYIELTRMLNQNGYKIIVCGLPAEKKRIQPLLTSCSGVIDMIGQLTLNEYIQLISSVDFFVASGTGPLHIAAMLGTKTLGLYPQRKVVGPSRWQPIGSNVHFLVWHKDCAECERNKECDCINRITPQEVFDIIQQHII